MNFYKTTSTWTVCVAFLTACGGGDVTVNNVPFPIDPSSVIQGFWSGTITNAPDGVTTASAVVTPSGTAWVVFGTGITATGLAKIPVTATPASSTEVAVSGSGHYFKLDTSPSKSISLSGTATTSNQFSVKFIGEAAATSWSWQGDPKYKIAAQATDLVANWAGTANGKSIIYKWTVDAIGAVTGSSSTGCTYSGTVKPNAAGVAVMDVAVTESCSGTTNLLSGIATLNSSKSKLEVAYATASDAEGGLLQLSKL